MSGNCVTRRELNRWNGAIIAEMRLSVSTGRSTDLAPARGHRLSSIARQVSCRSERHPSRACHPRATKRWVVRRKAAVVAAVRQRRNYSRGSLPLVPAVGGRVPFLATRVRDPWPCRFAHNAHSAVSRASCCTIPFRVAQSDSVESFPPGLAYSKFSNVILRRGGARDRSRHLGGLTYEPATGQRLAY